MPDPYESSTFEDRLERIKRRMEMLGHPVKVTSAKRSPNEQYNLWQQGRTKPGANITAADGLIYQSAHQADKARDMVFLDEKGRPTFEGPWELLGQAAEAEGLEWGGKWKNPDRVHVQEPGGVTDELSIEQEVVNQRPLPMKGDGLLALGGAGRPQGAPPDIQALMGEGQSADPKEAIAALIAKRMGAEPIVQAGMPPGRDKDPLSMRPGAPPPREQLDPMSLRAGAMATREIPSLRNAPAPPPVDRVPPPGGVPPMGGSAPSRGSLLARGGTSDQTAIPPERPPAGPHPETSIPPAPDQTMVPDIRRAEPRPSDTNQTDAPPQAPHGIDELESWGPPEQLKAPPKGPGRLAWQVRLKYPDAYKDVPDEELERRILDKYPQYQDVVTPEPEEDMGWGEWLGNIAGGIGSQVKEAVVPAAQAIANYKFPTPQETMDRARDQGSLTDTIRNTLTKLSESSPGDIAKGGADIVAPGVVDAFQSAPAGEGIGRALGAAGMLVLPGMVGRKPGTMLARPGAKPVAGITKAGKPKVPPGGPPPPPPPGGPTAGLPTTSPKVAALKQKLAASIAKAPGAPPPPPVLGAPALAGPTKPPVVHKAPKPKSPLVMTPQEMQAEIAKANAAAAKTTPAAQTVRQQGLAKVTDEALERIANGLRGDSTTPGMAQKLADVEQELARRAAKTTPAATPSNVKPFTETPAVHAETMKAREAISKIKADPTSAFSQTQVAHTPGLKAAMDAVEKAKTLFAKANTPKKLESANSTLKAAIDRVNELKGVKPGVVTELKKKALPVAEPGSPPPLPTNKKGLKSVTDEGLTKIAATLKKMDPKTPGIPEKIQAIESEIAGRQFTKHPETTKTAKSAGIKPDEVVPVVDKVATAHEKALRAAVDKAKNSKALPTKAEFESTFKERLKGEKGQVTNPITQAHVDWLGKQIIDYSYASMLSGWAPLKSWLGNFGAIHGTLTERAIGLDKRTVGRIFQQLGNPKLFAQQSYQALKQPVTAAQRTGRAVSGPFSIPGRIMQAGDIPTRALLRRAGMTAEEANRATLLNKARTDWGKWFSKGSKVTGGHFTTPFTTTVTNVVESGIERSPLAPFTKKLGGKTVFQRGRQGNLARARIVAGLGYGGAAYAASDQFNRIPDWANKLGITEGVARSLLAAAGGQYALPIAAGQYLKEKDWKILEGQLPYLSSLNPMRFKDRYIPPWLRPDDEDSRRPAPPTRPTRPKRPGM